MNPELKARSQQRKKSWEWPKILILPLTWMLKKRRQAKKCRAGIRRAVDFESDGGIFANLLKTK